MDVTRRREMPDDQSVARLQRAAQQRKDIEEELRQAVFAALDSGGSYRVVAELAGVSTRTIQNWLKDRK